MPKQGMEQVSEVIE